MIISPQELAEVREYNPDLSVALRFGCYDLLHEGHKEGLEFAGSSADVLVVGILPDAMVRRQKGSERPIITAQHRAERIDNAAEVDYTFIAPDSVIGIARAVRRLRPHTYIEHEEHNFSKIRRLYLGALGIKYTIDYGVKLNSTTAMLQKYGRTTAMQYSDALDVA